MSSALSGPDLIGLLTRLREDLVAYDLPFEAADAPPARAERDQLVKQLDDYILPRLQQIDAPLLAVVGGSTGAGKSVLVNSIVGTPVSATGVLRPTTRSPVLVHNFEDAGWFGTDRLLPDLERSDRATGDQSAMQLVPTESLPAGLAILDAPDIDSVVERNRRLAGQLLAAADLWLFVTSAARYADQVPWGFLREAAERSTQVAVVLDRTTPEALREVSTHLAHMMTERGLGNSPLFTVPEASVTDDGLLPPPAVEPIRRWLAALAADEAARTDVVRKTLSGAVASLGPRTRTVASALAGQEKIAARLRADAASAYDDALAAVDEATQDGSLLRGEVLARWQEFVGTGELLRNLESRVGRLRDWLFSAARGRPQPAQEVTVAVETGLETLIVEHAESAAERAALAWRSLPAGAALLREAPGDIGRATRDLRTQVERSVRDWQGAVLDLVRTEGSDRRATARVLAYGVNGLGVALMILIFAQTAGVTGAEVGVAGGTAVIAQKVLEAVFGDQAVRRLAEESHRELHARVADLYEQECLRYVDVLEQHAVAPGAAEKLLEVARDLDTARWSGDQTS